MIAACSDEQMFIVSGTVSTLYVTDGTLSLLEGMQSKMAAAGLGSALVGMPGSVANAAMVAMYDGEHVQHFGCYVGDQMVIGTFPGVGFKEGEEVKAVVTRLDEHVVFAHAVVRLPELRLWMPHSVDKGRYAIAAWIAKLMGWISLIGWCVFMLLNLGHSLEKIIERGLIFAGVMCAVSFCIGYLTYRSSPEGPYAERILKVLGFRNPKVVNLAPYCERSLGLKTSEQGGSIQVYDLPAALKAYDSLRKPAPVAARKP